MTFSMDRETHSEEYFIERKNFFSQRLTQIAPILQRALETYTKSDWTLAQLAPQGNNQGLHFVESTRGIGFVLRVQTGEVGECVRITPKLPLTPTGKHQYLWDVLPQNLRAPGTFRQLEFGVEQLADPDQLGRTLVWQVLIPLSDLWGYVDVRMAEMQAAHASQAAVIAELEADGYIQDTSQTPSGVTSVRMQAPSRPTLSVSGDGEVYFLYPLHTTVERARQIAAILAE